MTYTTSTYNWIISLEEDVETGELIMPLPKDLLEIKGWKIGDTLAWKINDDGTWTLTKEDDQ